MLPYKYKLTMGSSLSQTSTTLRLIFLRVSEVYQRERGVFIITGLCCWFSCRPLFMILLIRNTAMGAEWCDDRRRSLGLGSFSRSA